MCNLFVCILHFILTPTQKNFCIYKTYLLLFSLFLTTTSTTPNLLQLVSAICQIISENLLQTIIHNYKSWNSVFHNAFCCTIIYIFADLLFQLGHKRVSLFVDAREKSQKIFALPVFRVLCCVWCVANKKNSFWRQQMILICCVCWGSLKNRLDFIPFENKWSIFWGRKPKGRFNDKASRKENYDCRKSGEK